MLFHINKSRPIVAYFGLIRHGKGLEDLVKAWRRVLEKVDAEMLIIGGRHPYLKDNCYENLVKLIRKLGLERSIHFCGYVPNDMLPAYFTRSDVFVFPYNEWGDVYRHSVDITLKTCSFFKLFRAGVKYPIEVRSHVRMLDNL